jgi:hypothetical protein
MAGRPFSSGVIILAMWPAQAPISSFGCYVGNPKNGTRQPLLTPMNFQEGL